MIKLLTPQLSSYHPGRKNPKLPRLRKGQIINPAAQVLLGKRFGPFGRYSSLSGSLSLSPQFLTRRLASGPEQPRYLRDIPRLLVSPDDSFPGQKRCTLAKFIVSRVYIFCHWGFLLLSFKSFNKIFKGGSPAFSSANLINLPASSNPIPTAGLPPRRFQILP